MRSAIVIGATGLVGMHLVQLLLKDTRFDKVKVFVRRSMPVTHEKLEEHIIDFDAPDGWKKLVTGDVLYSALGTTLRVAGSKEAQYKIDHDFQLQFARIAAANGVPQYVLISAAGADTGSRIFYSRMKGELERDVQRLPFEAIHIIRPGMLTGERKEVRTGEKLGIGVMNIVGSIPGLAALKPIQGREVARAALNATFSKTEGISSYSMGDVFKLAKRV